MQENPEPLFSRRGTNKMKNPPSAGRLSCTNEPSTSQTMFANANTIPTEINAICCRKSEDTPKNWKHHCLKQHMERHPQLELHRTWEKVLPFTPNLLFLLFSGVTPDPNPETPAPISSSSLTSLLWLSLVNWVYFQKAVSPYAAPLPGSRCHHLIGGMAGACNALTSPFPNPLSEWWF